jgi:hypothetical protein
VDEVGLMFSVDPDYLCGFNSLYNCSNIISYKFLRIPVKKDKLRLLNQSAPALSPEHLWQSKLELALELALKAGADAAAVAAIRAMGTSEL